uniref:OSJNBa0079C19.7 protein n=1 Tax=Oryza sativa subsp. japonica TaxID=39947 RepID=Q7XM75_ORYSJ|nr:OSJNBa0079C19.7 [Oryza sativa Japonica Group]
MAARGGRLAAVSGGARVCGGNGASGVDLRSGPVAGMRHGAAALWEAAARPGEVGIAGGERLETEGRAAARFSRWGGISVVVWGKRRGGRGAARRGEADGTHGAARWWLGWREKAAGELRRAAAARLGEGRAGEGAGSSGKLGKWERRPRGSFLLARGGGIMAAEGGIDRQRSSEWAPATWAKWGGSAPVLEGESGEESGGGGATRSRGRGERAGGGGGGIGGDVGRPWRRFRLREPEVRDGPDRGLNKYDTLGILSDEMLQWMVISDGGSHFIDKTFRDLLRDMGAKHNVATPYHPQTSELEHRAYWAIRNWNMDFEGAREWRKLQITELEEWREKAYHNAKIYKERTKRWHDKRIKIKKIKPGDKVLMFNSRVKLFGHGKLHSKWEGPFDVIDTSSHGAITLRDDSGNIFKPLHSIAPSTLKPLIQALVPFMVGKSLMPYIGSSSNNTYNLEGEPTPVNQLIPVEEYMMEGVNAVWAQPLAVVPGSPANLEPIGELRGLAEPGVEPNPSRLRSAPHSAVRSLSPRHVTKTKIRVGFAGATADNGRARSMEGAMSFPR